jgi:hypothetical protein
MLGLYDKLMAVWFVFVYCLGKDSRGSDGLKRG